MTMSSPPRQNDYAPSATIAALEQRAALLRKLRRFFDEFNAAGVIPTPLIRWQMTGIPPTNKSQRTTNK